MGVVTIGAAFTALYAMVLGSAIAVASWVRARRKRCALAPARVITEGERLRRRIVYGASPLQPERGIRIESHIPYRQCPPHIYVVGTLGCRECGHVTPEHVAAAHFKRTIAMPSPGDGCPRS